MLLLEGNLVGVLDDGIILTSQLLKGLALGLRNAQRSEDTQEHEQGINLEHVVEPRIGICLGSATYTEGCNGSLGNDGADFACGGGDTVRC